MEFNQQYGQLCAPVRDAIKACKTDEEGIQVGSIVAYIGIEILREIMTDKGAAQWLYQQADKLAAK